MLGIGAVLNTTHSLSLSLLLSLTITIITIVENIQSKYVEINDMRKEAENMQLSITDRKARLGNDYDDKLDNELKKILNNFSKAMESKSK